MNTANTARILKRLSYSAVGALALGLAGPALAQGDQQSGAAGAEPREEIIVRGVRGALRNSVERKRAADSVVDVISSEDIGKFPDTNLAESLQRVTGVQITRDDTGQGARVSIRGLNPFFSKVTVNGQAIAEPSSYEVGAASGFDLSLLRSDLASSVEVIKSPTADLEEGGVGGTINIVTRRPFDFEGRTAVLSLGANHEDLADATSPDLSFLFSDTFADGRVGLLLNGGYRERDVRNDSIDARGWSLSDVILDDEIVEDVLVMDRPRQRAELLEERQLSLGGTLQFRPTQTSMLYVDALYGEKRADNYFQFSQWETDRGSTTNPDHFLGGTLATDATGVQYLTSGAFGNMELSLNNRFRELNEETVTLTGGGEWAAGDWFYSGALAWSSGDSDQDVTNTKIVRRRGSFVGMYDIRPETATNAGVAEPLTLSIMEPAGFSAGDPLGFSDIEADGGNGCGGSVVRCTQGGTNDYTDSEDVTVNFDAARELSWGDVSQLAFGVRLRTTEANRLRPSTSLQEGVDGDIFPDITEAPAGFGDRLGSVPFWADYEGLGVPAWYDLDEVFAIAEANGGYLRDAIRPADTLNTTQDIYAGYVMLDADGELGTRPYRANIGVRLVQTEVSSDGSIVGLGDAAPTRFASEGDYFDALPSGNIAIDLTEHLVLRLAAAEVMTRPPIDATTSSVSVSFEDDNENEVIDPEENATFSYGNPDLDPFRAWQYDISLEYYTPQGGLLNAGYFHKDIDTFITEERLGCGDDPFGFATDIAFEASAASDGTCRFLGDDGNGELVIIQQVNGEGAKVSGFEVGMAQPFTFLPAPFDGFGLIANYTYVDSDTNLVDPQTGVELPFEGVSESSYNVIGFYENELLSARVSYNYRDDYLVEDINARCNCSVFLESRGQVDASVKWNVLERLTLSLDALNLTDERFRQYVGSVERVRRLSENGRRFVIAARYEF